MRTCRGFVLALSLLAALSACGVTAPRGNEGYADLDALPGPDADTTIDISLGPTLLGLAARLVDDDPATRALLQSLRGVRIKVYEIEEDSQGVASELDRMGAELEQEGWERVIQVREQQGKTTQMLVKISGDKVAGLTVLATDSVAVTLVNVLGPLQPEMFGRAIAALDAP